MRVKLRVLAGKNAGREIELSVPEFFIGRGDDCHLRPRSDLVSRQHTAIKIGDDGVKIRDLGSRNGTYLNGERIEDEQTVKPGDQLRVGRLEMEFLIDHSLPGKKRPKVKSVKDAAARTAKSDLEEMDISDWLEEADEIDREQRIADPDTRQFRLDETDRVVLEKASEASEQQTEEESESDTSEDRVKKIKDQKPGKLPKRPGAESKDSREAATEMLKQFFNRR